LAFSPEHPYMAAVTFSGFNNIDFNQVVTAII
jgi:hypothetical protein